MPGDIFSLVLLACVGTPSVETCQVRSVEPPHTLATHEQCEQAYATAKAEYAALHVDIREHRCYSIASLFPGATTVLGPNKPPTPEPQSDAPQPRVHL